MVRSIRNVELALGSFDKKPTIDEIAEEVELSPEDVESLLAQSEQVAFLTLDDLGAIAADQTDVPWELLSQGTTEILTT